MKTQPGDADLWPVPVQVLARLSEELRAQDVDATAMKAAFSRLDAVLGQPEATLPYADAVDIIDRALALVADPGSLGVRVGQRANVADWGVLGYAVICCSTLGEAMALAPRYYRAAPGLTRLELDEVDGETILTSSLPRPIGRAGEFSVEEDFSGILGVAASLTGVAIPLREVRFAHAAPADRSVHDRCFNGPVVFGAERNQIVFAAEAMQLPLRLASPSSKASATLLCDQYLEKHPAESDLASRVRHLLVHTGLRARQEDEVARLLSMSARSMRRQLAAEGSSFRQILDSTRESLAFDLLRGSALKIEQIAEQLGYSDASTFRRAFKLRVGKTPSEWRERR